MQSSSFNAAAWLLEEDKEFCDPARSNVFWIQQCTKYHAEGIDLTSTVPFHIAEKIYNEWFSYLQDDAEERRQELLKQIEALGGGNNDAKLAKDAIDAMVTLVRETLAREVGK